MREPPVEQYACATFRSRIIAIVVTALIFFSPIASCGLASRLTSRAQAEAFQAEAVEDGASDFPVTFSDVTRQAGLSAEIIYCGVEQKKYIIETNGCGVAFIDYDNDGWMDALLLSGTRLEGFPKGKEPTNRLYHNNHDGTFSDVTARAGLVATG